MVGKVPIPFFPSAPTDYDPQYITQIVRAFALYTEQQNSGGQGRHTEMVLTNLQSHDDNLEVGSIFEHNGFLKISKVNTPHPQGISGTSALGSVTVSTP
jgi:hypothetical protein